MKTYSKTSFKKIGRPHGLKPLKLEKPSKANFAHFIKPPAWWKSTQRTVWQKCWLFKALNLEKLKKGKLCSFCKRLLGEKVLKDMLLKVLELKNPQKRKLYSFCKPLTWWKEVCRSKKAKFTHFVSRPFDLFDKGGNFWKPWSSKSLKTQILFILWATGVIRKYIKSSFRDVYVQLAHIKNCWAS